MDLLPRKQPWWAHRQIPHASASSRGGEVTALLNEVYAAVNGGQHRLAAMGIRALLERIMIINVGDQHSFDANLDEFHKKGYISLFQRDALSATLNAGHAVTHRGFQLSPDELDTALNITENIIEAIFIHPESAEELARRVPPRPPRPKRS